MYLYIVEVLRSALKHGYSTSDIRHAYDNALRLVEYDYGGDKRLLEVGPDQVGNLMEVADVPTQTPLRVMHADALRPKFCSYLRQY